MLNSTSPPFSYFILGAFVDVGLLKYVLFLVVLAVYAVIVGSNLLLVVVICVNRSLHEPMYMFLCSLFVNELYGSTGLFPFLLVQILSDLHTVSAPLCFLQVFCLYSYVKVEFCNLALMSYDRYLAICRPLLYRVLMPRLKVLLLLLLMWSYCLLSFLGALLLSARLQLCGNVLNSTFCRNYLLVRLACEDTTLNNVYGLCGTVLTVLVPLLPILYSYAKILRVCSSGSTSTRQKAASTCGLHLASLLNFSFGCLFEILQSRLDLSGAPPALQALMSLYFVALQPLLNPLMYGLQTAQIRRVCGGLLRRRSPGGAVPGPLGC
ncbi:olfactory receptor 10A6-like [Menidia menidia]